MTHAKMIAQHSITFTVTQTYVSYYDVNIPLSADKYLLYVMLMYLTIIIIIIINDKCKGTVTWPVSLQGSDVNKAISTGQGQVLARARQITTSVILHFTTKVKHTLKQTYFQTQVSRS